MEAVLQLDQFDVEQRQYYGGKAVGLSVMIGLGLNVPPEFVVTTDPHRASVVTTVTTEAHGDFVL